jgi:hypothetical protein
MPYRRKSAKVEAYKINGPVKLDDVPRWLLVAMAEGRITKGVSGIVTHRLSLQDGSVGGYSIFDSDWIVKDGNKLSVVSNGDFMQDYEEHP